MKKIILSFATVTLFFAGSIQAQNSKKKTATETTVEPVKEDKSKRPSPPATASVTTAKGTAITINYSQPAVKGREIGKDIAPYGKVWRTGANETTTLDITQNVEINGQFLPAGKYGIHTIPGEKKWKLMINKTWDSWGTDYDANNDIMSVDLVPQKSPEFVERLTFKINKEGRTVMMWGNVVLDFMIY